MQETEYFNIARAEQSHWWYAAMRATCASWLRRLPFARGRAAPRILDAGCGAGGGLRWLSDLGRAFGVDVHSLALELASGKGRAPLARADVRALPFQRNSFDAVTSFDVLCQLEQGGDLAALREFTRVLRPGGWLLLRLPAHETLRGAHDLCVKTRRRYSRGEVRAKLRGVGLHVARVSYANAAILPPALAWRTLQRLLASKPASDVRETPRWLGFLLELLLGAERAWLRHFDLPFGLSVLALARKASA